MIWYTWRQSRIVLLGLLVLTVGFAVALILVGMHMYQDVHVLQNPICQQSDTCTATSNDLTSQQMLFHSISIGLLALPALIGFFIGAPLVAGEYEQRTYQFIWTQGVTRRRWLTIQLAILFGVVIALTAILGLVINWGTSATFAPAVLQNAESSERFSLWGFDLSGTVPMAYAAFALALGLASGALLRRTLPAVAVMLAGYLGVRLSLAVFVRPYYMPPVLRTMDLRKPVSWDSITGPYAWVLEQGSRLHGHLYANGLTVPDYCVSDAAPSAVNAGALNQCLHDHGWSLYVLYQPYERFWLFQGIETAIFLALAAGLVAATFALILRRPR